MRDTYPIGLLEEHAEPPEPGAILERFRRLVIDREDPTASESLAAAPGPEDVDEPEQGLSEDVALEASEEPIEPASASPGDHEDSAAEVALEELPSDEEIAAETDQDADVVDSDEIDPGTTAPELTAVPDREVEDAELVDEEWAEDRPASPGRSDTVIHMPAFDGPGSDES